MQTNMRETSMLCPLYAETANWQAQSFRCLPQRTFWIVRAMIHEKGAVVVASIKTVGEDGSATTEPLWPGLYKIVEVTPPTGYLPGTGSITMDARGAAEQSAEAIITYESVITNSIALGAQAIVKILGDNSHDPDPSRVETPESGAEFAVYLRKAGSYEAAREFERDYLTTDENGYAMTKPLPYGIYMLEQASGKAGLKSKGPIAFEIDGTESLVNPPPSHSMTGRSSIA